MLATLKSLCDENRLRLLNILMHYELCVCEIEVLLGLSQSNVSRHLGILRNQKLISGSKDGQWVHYKVDARFSEENALLIAYLKQGFEREEVFIQDLERCKVYKESSLSCQEITSDKGSVEAYIQQRVSAQKDAQIGT